MGDGIGFLVVDLGPDIFSLWMVGVVVILPSLDALMGAVVIMRTTVLIFLFSNFLCFH